MYTGSGYACGLNKGPKRVETVNLGSKGDAWQHQRQLKRSGEGEKDNGSFLFFCLFIDVRRGVRIMGTLAHARGVGDGKGVGKGVGVLKGDDGAGGHRAAVVEEAVVDAEAAEDAGVDKAGRAEGTAAEMDVAHGAAAGDGAEVQD